MKINLKLQGTTQKCRTLFYLDTLFKDLELNNILLPQLKRPEPRKTPKVGYPLR